jgi:hypothetical protein
MRLWLAGLLAATACGSRTPVNGEAENPMDAAAPPANVEAGAHDASIVTDASLIEDATAIDATAPPPDSAIDATPDRGFILGGCSFPEVPLTCERLATCGPSSDGFGNLLECGPCPAGSECVAGTCTRPDAGTCVPLTCADYGAGCGAVSDGCGGTIPCGDCAPPQYCGGGGLRRCGGVCTTEPVNPDMDCGLTTVCQPDPPGDASR